MATDAATCILVCHRKLHRLELLLANRGILNGKPMYNARHLRRWSPQIRQFSSAMVDNVNHYTILMSPQGADAVAGEIRRLAETPR